MVTGIAGIDLTARAREKSKQAFSLIEVLLVLALVAVMAGLVAGNLGSFIQGSNYEPPDRVLKRAVLDAVYYSSERKRATSLTYQEQNATFSVTDSMGEKLATHKVYQTIDQELASNSELIPEVQFYAIGPLSGVDGGDGFYDDAQLRLTRVNFHSGSSLPFQATIRFRGEVDQYNFDPFSGYVLKKDE